MSNLISSTHLSSTAVVDQESIKPFPGSKKVYIQGSRPDIQVPMRAIQLADSPASFSKEALVEKNEPVMVYDTSGPYTDPNVIIDVRKGLNSVRENWILERDDTQLLDGLSSQYGLERAANSRLDSLRFNLERKPRKAKEGCNVTQLHYARKGIITPEMEYIAIRENMKLVEAKLNPELNFQHPGQSFGANLPQRNHT